MTEKKQRFKLGYVCGDYGLIDNDDVENRWTDLYSMSANSEKNVQICIQKMNELANENEQLKQRVDVLDDQITAQGIVIDGYQNRNQNLFDENEELKDDVYDEMDDALEVLVELYEYVPFDSRKKMNRLYNRLKSLRDDMND